MVPVGDSTPCKPHMGGGGPTCKQNVNMQAFDTKFLLERRYRMFLKHSEQHAPLL